MLESLLLWIHLLSMIGAFGVLLGDLVGLHKATRANAGAARLASLLLAVGLPAGLWLYRLKIAAGWGALGLHRTIGIKFVLLVGAGAFLGIASKQFRNGRPAPAAKLQGAAVALLAMAALVAAVF